MIWGIDLGGTKIEGVVLQDIYRQEPICRLRVPTEGHLGYRHVLNQINLLVQYMAGACGSAPKAVGIGTPGALEPATGLLKNSNTTCLNNQPIKTDLEKLLNCKVAMANDANCFALAEAVMGSVPGEFGGQVGTVFGIIMGTGVGGGIVINNKILNGHHGIAGEWGHNFLDNSGGPCYCGRIGCVETLISGPALEKFYFNISGNRKHLKEINQLAEKGEDSAAVATINRLIEMFGRAVGPIINVLDPDAIVLGGGVGNIDALYTRGVEEVKKYTFNHELQTKFLKPTLGDSAGVYGAATLVA